MPAEVDHCPATLVALLLQYAFRWLHQRGLPVRFLAVGSTAGLEAAGRGECDVAGMHLFDPATGRYNEPFIDETIVLFREVLAKEDMQEELLEMGLIP
ncbi:MAG: substrate-binding domain-containing protein [Thermoguttaceae bacterium]|nr:substrate-binding domain-containing protein [Thermoguttaceae bacterium]